MISTLISTLGGALFGQVQNFVETKQNNNKEIQLAKLKHAKEIDLAKLGLSNSKANLQIEEERTTQSFNKKQAEIAKANAEKYSNFANTVKETSSLWKSRGKLANISNFIVTTTRPFVTYILLLGVIIHPENEGLRLTLDCALGYWFVRRSFEKGKGYN